MKTLLEKYPRLRDWYNIGPVQRAELEAFVEAFCNLGSAVTADGKLVKESDTVWVINSLGTPTPTTVRPLKAYTYYELFGPVSVAASFSTKRAAQRYIKDAHHG